MKSKLFPSAACVISLLAVAVVAPEASATLVTGTFSGSTSQEQFFVVQANGFYGPGSTPSQTGPFSGTFQFDTTGAVDTNPDPNVAAYALTGTITGFGGPSSAVLMLASNVGFGTDTFKLSSGVPGFDYIVDLSSLPAATYSPGNFVPEIPLNLTGLIGATFTRNQKPSVPGPPGSTGQVQTGTIENFTLSVVASVPESSPIYLAPLLAAALWWRSRRTR